MEDKEKVIVKQAVLKATALLVPSVKLDNATPTDVSKVTIQIAQDLFDWVFKDVGTVKDVGTGAAQNTKAEKQDDRPGFEPKCPVCDSFVWDNRETATSQQPKWRCKNEDCTGGSFSKKYNRLMAWASWDSDEFANAQLKTNGVEDKLEKVNGAGVVVDDTETTPPF